jgi:Hydrogenase/urease nickel incorporation, metallochaperone, hypA
LEAVRDRLLLSEYTVAERPERELRPFNGSALRRKINAASLGEDGRDLIAVLVGPCRRGRDGATQGTAAEGASLEVHEIEGLARCEVCGREFEMETFFTPCPCVSVRLKRIRGEEVIVKSMKMVEAA